MKLKKAIIGIMAILILVLIGFYQYQVSQDRDKKFIYSEELRLYPKRSFTEEDSFEKVSPGSSVQILRLKSGSGSTDVYIEVNGKRGWVTSARSSFEIRD